MAILCHLEPPIRSSYTGSLPCLPYSRSMISSIMTTNETLCYLLAQCARQQRPRFEDTRYCPDAPDMMHSGLYGKSRRRRLARKSDTVLVWIAERHTRAKTPCGGLDGT